MSNLALTPWPPHSAWRGRENRELPLLWGSRQSSCLYTTVSIIWDVGLRSGTFEGESCLEAAVGLPWCWQVLRESEVLSLAPGSIRSRSHQQPSEWDWWQEGGGEVKRIRSSLRNTKEPLIDLTN